MYDPQLGQFLSEDPTGFDGLDENLRRYVGNRTTVDTDPTGLAPKGKFFDPIGRIFRPGGNEFNNYDGIGIWRFREQQKLHDFLNALLGPDWAFHSFSPFNLGRGCVGLAMYRVGLGDGYRRDGRGRLDPRAPIDAKVRYPHEVPGTLFFESEAAAKAYWDENDPNHTKYVLVAWQQEDLGFTRNDDAHPNRGKGQLFKDELSFDDNSGKYNFSTFIESPRGFSYWEYAEAKFLCMKGDLGEGVRDDIIYHQPTLPVDDPNYSKTIIYMLVPYTTYPRPRQPK